MTKSSQTDGQIKLCTLLYRREKNSLCWVIAGDERESDRSFHYTSEPSTMEWEHPSSPQTLSASKVLDSVVWIHRMYCRWSSWNMDVHLTANSEPHWKACHRPSGECPSLLSDGVILLHDNAWPHTAQQNFGSEILDHTIHIWYPLILCISHIEWSLITALFHHWWRH